jgi:hypothetical protein
MSRFSRTTISTTPASFTIDFAQRRAPDLSFRAVAPAQALSHARIRLGKELAFAWRCVKMCA